MPVICAGEKVTEYGGGKILSDVRVCRLPEAKIMPTAQKNQTITNKNKYFAWSMDNICVLLRKLMIGAPHVNDKKKVHIQCIVPISKFQI